KAKAGPSIIVIAQPSINLLGRVYERGLKVVTSSYRRVPPQSLSPSIKSLNYLNNIMAKVEANQYGADEALMLDIHGYVSEASAENVFIVRNHTIVTPFTSTNLPGVTRETVLELAPSLHLEAKEQFFTRYGIPVLRGIVASKPEEITDPPLPCMVKAQVLVGGRGKAGGIRPAQTLEEARQVAGQILGMDIHGYRVKQVYLEERLSIAKELYLGLTIDRSAREPLLMATAMGGMDVEEVPREDLFMEHVPAMIGIQPYIIRSLAGALSIERDIAEQVASIARRAYDLFRKEDVELVEINPLIVTGGGRVIAGDAKLVIDDSAEYRHP